MTMKKNIIKEGQRFGRFVVIKEDKPHRYPNGTTRRKFLMQCDCGNTKSVMINHIKSGRSTSCGCLRKEELIKRNKEGAVELKEGMKFGRLTVVKEVKGKLQIDGRTKRCFLFKCDCGEYKEIEAQTVKLGQSTSCGCYSREQARDRLTTHGMSSTRTYNIRAGMLQRCKHKDSPHYKYRGGRGITVCERRNKFESFLEDMGLAPEDRSIDRIDNDGNYCKENCRRATAVQQANNKRPMGTA